MPDGHVPASSALASRLSDLDAERAVLASGFLDSVTVSAARAIVAPDDFEDPKHALVWEVMLEVVDAGSPIDFITVGDGLRRRARLNSVGGVQWLAELSDTIPTTAHVESHARIVRDLSLRRRLHDALVQASAVLLDSASAEEALTRIRAEIDRVERSVPSTDDGNLIVAADRLFAAMERAGEGQGTGIATGVDDLDAEIGGYFPGDLIFLGADPSRGKTAMALQAVRRCAEAGRESLVFSYEMQRTRVLHRLAQHLCGVGEQQVRTGRLTAQSLQDYGRAVGESAALPVRVFDRGATIEEVVARVRARCAKARVGLVVVDYLQIMTATPKVDDPMREVARLTRLTKALKALAIECDVPVLVLSQFNRTGNKAKEPTIHDFKGSGSIESDADAVLMLHAENDTTDERIVIVGKNRAGVRAGRVTLRWNGAHQWLHSPEAESAQQEREF